MEEVWHLLYNISKQELITKSSQTPVSFFTQYMIFIFVFD